LSLLLPLFVTLKTCCRIYAGTNLLLLENVFFMLYAQKKFINHPHHPVNTVVDSIGDMGV
jgi:hypothetical protein